MDGEFVMYDVLFDWASDFQSFVLDPVSEDFSSFPVFAPPQRPVLGL